MRANEAKRLRELDPENARLKKLLAEAELDKAIPPRRNALHGGAATAAPHRLLLPQPAHEHLSQPSQPRPPHAREPLLSG
jgi:hypothetical protein